MLRVWLTGMEGFNITWITIGKDHGIRAHTPSTKDPKTKVDLESCLVSIGTVVIQSLVPVLAGSMYKLFRLIPH